MAGTAPSGRAAGQRMIRPKQLVLNDAVEWLGDYHPLAEQLGSADGLVELGSIAAFLEVRPVWDLESLRFFLKEYHEQILIPFELPAIDTAHGHTERNELRELVAFDQQHSSAPILRPFAAQMEALLKERSPAATHQDLR